MPDSRGRTSLKIPPDLMEKIKAQAEKENRTVHNMILTILKRSFDREKQDSNSTPSA